MKNNLLVLATILLATISTAFGQNALNTTQLGHLPYNQDLSEVRGALHNGREYALVGVYNGFSIVDVTDPTALTEVFFESGPNSIWRDPFYHNGHAYCVTEGGGGLLIVNMNPLPASTSLSTTLYTGSQYPFSSAHNMFIDGANDRAYIFGTNNIDGVIILDISNPMSPTELGIWNDYYIHDGFVRGDTLWAGCLEDGAFVVDVSVPSNPVILANWDTPSEFAHNIWPSDDNMYSYTTDEVNSGFVAAYDMSNLTNVLETDKVRHPLSQGVIPHNTHFKNDYIVTSHYRDGLSIHDVSDPSNIILTGYFDSSPMSGSGFNGAWGAWPYLPSGNILVSDIEEGLFVLGVTYQRGARLKGTVTEFGSGSVLNNVQIDIVSLGINEATNLFGKYATGTQAAGTYEVTFQKGGYISQTITGVVLQNGQTVTLDVQLVPDVAFSITGTVTEEGTGNPIEGAVIQFVNSFFDLELASDGSGNYVNNSFYAGQYEYTVAAWGYGGVCGVVDISSGQAPDFELPVGYFDDFSLDLGWTVSGNAGAGIWERGAPVQTDFNGQVSNPGQDVLEDCSDLAYITGNGGGSAGTDDVDDGVTILTSPIMDLTTYTEPVLQFEYWFLNAGGNSTPNDSYLVKIDNGTDVATIASLSQSNGQWNRLTEVLSTHISITSTMQLVLEVEDIDPGHLLEGGIDLFNILEATGINGASKTTAVSIYPNPASEFVNVVFDGNVKSGFVQITDLAGRALGQVQSISTGVNRIELPDVYGVYLCEVIVNSERVVQRLLIHD